MPDDIPMEQLRAAAESLTAQIDALDAEKTALHLQEWDLKMRRREINMRQNELVLAQRALEYRAGEKERGGAGGPPSASVSAIIESAIAAAEGVPPAPVVGDPAA